jgi:hypothetical protein
MKKPVLAKINIVAKQYDETLKFYRLIRINIPDPTPPPPGCLNAQAKNEGMDFALDNENLARIYHAGWVKRFT